VLEEVFRDEWGRVLASLVGFLGDFDKAEDAVQEAFAIAAERWPASGVPPNPGAWLTTTARNRAIDRIRRERTLAGKIHLLPEPEAVMDEFDDTVIKDERLELIFTCCHPALPLDGQVALTLRALGYSGRVDLAAEAIRLGRVLATLMPDEPEAHGLLALMMIHHARRRARFSGEDLVLLEDQDRSLWDHAQIAAGRAVLDRAVALGGRGAYVIQAVIASLQTAERIDWPQVAEMYRRLAELTGSAVVELNRAVAVAQAGDPAAALRAVEALDLDGYLYYHSTRGELLRRLGRGDEAKVAYSRALELATTPPERRFLTRRLEQT